MAGGIRYSTEDAKRLRLDQLVDIGGFARAAGVMPLTLHSYRTSRRKDRIGVPEPVAHVGTTPVWTKDQTQEWIKHRPLAGERDDRDSGVTYATGVAPVVAAALVLDDLVDIEGFARAAGVTARTIHGYRHSRRVDYAVPEPVAHVGITPVWTKEQAREWIRQRPGAGARTDLYRSGHGVNLDLLDEDRLISVGGEE